MAECGCLAVLQDYMPLDLARIVQSYVIDVNVDRISDWLYKHTDTAFIGRVLKHRHYYSVEWTFSVRLFNGAVQLFAESEQYGCIKMYDSAMFGVYIKPEKIGDFLINLSHRDLIQGTYEIADPDAENLDWMLTTLSRLMNNLYDRTNSPHIIKNGEITFFGRLGEQFNQALPGLMCH